MVTEQETLIYIEEKDKAGASAQAKGFAKNSVKNRAYVNTLGVELAMKYLASEGVNVSNLYNLHSVHKFLEEFDIADIILPNVHIDVRVVFSDKFIFVPKSHFEYGLTPDIYLILQLSEDYSHVKFLGFVEPKLINKNNANKDYYFIEKEKLSAVSNLKEYIENTTKNTTQILDETTIDLLESHFISMVDNNLSENDKKDLIGNLLKSASLRDKFIEYSNFEILSYKAMNDESFKEYLNNSENTSDITPIAGAIPSANDIFDNSEEAVSSNAELSSSAVVSDEFDLFDNNNADEFGTFDAEDSSISSNQTSGTNITENILPDFDIVEDIEDSLDTSIASEAVVENIWDTAADMTAENILDDFAKTSEDYNSSVDLSLDNILEENSTDTISNSTEELELNNLDMISDTIQETDNSLDATSDENDIIFEEHISSDEPFFLQEDTDIADSSEPTMIGFDDININSIENVNIDDSQELISFDDIDVSINEDIDKYRADETSASDAVAFDVLEPVSMDVESNENTELEGSFLTQLSPDISETISIDSLIQTEVKQDIVDEEITGIGAIDNLGISDLSDMETLSDSNDESMNIEMIENVSEDFSSNIETLSSNDAMDLTLSDSLDLSDNLDSMESLDSLESLDPSDSLDNLEMLNPADDINFNENPAEFETPETFDAIDNLEPVGNLEELSFSESSVDGFSADNIESINESDSLVDLSSDNNFINDDLNIGSTSLDNLETLSSSNASDSLMELDGNLDNLENIDNISMDNFSTEIPAAAESKPLESFADNIDNGPLQLRSVDDSNMSFDDITVDESSLIQPVSELNSSEHLNLNEDSNMSFDNIAIDASTESDNLETITLSEDLNLINDNNMSFDNIETIEPVKEPSVLNELPEEAINTIYPKGNAPDYDNEEEPLPEIDGFTSTVTENQTDNIDLGLKLDNSEELMTFNTELEPQTEDLSLALIEEEESAPKPIDIMQSNLIAAENDLPNKKPTIAEHVLEDELEQSEELNSEALLAEIDNILGPEADNNLQQDETIPLASINKTIENQDLSPEEAIYMQTMAKEKGKKGMTLLLVLVAAFLGVFTISTFIKNSKGDKISDLGLSSDAEVLDSIGNEPYENNKPEPVKVNKPEQNKDMSANTPKLEEIKPEELKASTTASNEMYNTNIKGSIYPEVKKISFEVPDYLTYSDGIKKYLQTVGRSIKLSATSDLLLTSDYSVSDRVKVNLKLTPNGDIKNADIDISSGSKQIDKIVLQSVKNTLNVVKPPAGEVKGDDFNLAVIINF